MTTGAEACENAIKIARIATGRNAVIAFGGGFHGRTFMGMSLTGKVEPYKKGFGSMMPDVFHVPFPMDVHNISTKDAMAGDREAVQGRPRPGPRGGDHLRARAGRRRVLPGADRLVKAIRALLCDQHGIVMIADEVQTGFARTGNLFAMEMHGVAADLTTMAKGLAGGLPLAAVTAKPS